MHENELNGTVSKEIYQECEVYIENAKETRHNKVLQRQVSKFQRLIQKNSAKKSGHSKQCHSGIYMYMHSGNSSRYMYQQDTDTNQVHNSRSVQDPDPDPDSHPDQDQDKDQKKKWVINLSDVPLTPTQEASFVPQAKLCSDTKKSTHCRIYNILGSGLPEAKHQHCRGVKI